MLFSPFPHNNFVWILKLNAQSIANFRHFAGHRLDELSSTVAHNLIKTLSVHCKLIEECEWLVDTPVVHCSEQMKLVSAIAAGFSKEKLWNYCSSYTMFMEYVKLCGLAVIMVSTLMSYPAIIFWKWVINNNKNQKIKP